MRQIGIMLDWNILKKAYEGKKTYERLHYYEELGKELGLNPVFFHPLNVDFSNRKVKGYSFREGKLVKKVTTLPAVMHNRILTGNRKTNQAIFRLSRMGKVYNGIVARNKATVHSILWRNPQLHAYLPHTSYYSKANLLRFLNRFPIVYVKPVIGSVGVGVARIEREGDYYLFVAAGKRELLGKQAVAQAVANWIKGRRFLIQQGIQLAKYEGQTFDIRVSVQKDGARVWRVSGMVCKVANPHNKLSNLARGGRAEPIDRVLSTLFSTDRVEEVKGNIAKAAVEIAKQYNMSFPSLADLGMDMGIDRLGNPYLIEVNVRDQRYSFFKAGSIDMFKQTYRRPLEFGKSFFV